MPLLVLVITILMLLVIAPCIINCLIHFVSAQVNKLQHVVPVEQGYIKLQPTTEKISLTLRWTLLQELWGLRLAKGGGPKPLAIPVQQEVARETSMSLFPKIGPPISWGNRKKESKMAVPKRKRREKSTEIEQSKVWGPEWGLQVKQTALLTNPIYIGQA